MGEDGAPLPHLDGASRGLRQAIAAHFLAGIPHVVEIGGAGLPLTAFLAGPHRSVTVIDPKIAPLSREILNGRACRVRHIAAKVQANVAVAPAGAYAVAMLGLSLKALGQGPAVSPELQDLIGGAVRVVIDHALDLERATGQLPAILSACALPVTVSMEYALADGTIEKAGFGRRRLIVLG
jgi:hypothetical protein